MSPNSLGRPKIVRCVSGPIWSTTAFGLIALFVVPVFGSSAPTPPEYAPSMFAVYERNRQEGVANYITEDFLLASYGLTRVAVGKSVERELYAGLLRNLVERLQAAVQEQEDDSPVRRANRDFLAVLAALAEGRPEAADAADLKRAQAELDLVLAANEIARSPLWGYSFDYAQFLPRGHYEGDEPLTRYFRAARYAGAALFAVKPSRATGVSRKAASRMAAQAEQLARLIDADAELAATHRDLIGNLTWRFGPAEDLTNHALLAVPAEPKRTHAERLFAQARDNDMQPRILGGIVDARRLEKDVTPQDALTGWRLLPQRRSVDYAAFQHLLHDGTGVFKGSAEDVAEDQEPPFGLTLIDGQGVKGFPLLAELMAFWGSAESAETLKSQQETAFAGYADAALRAKRELADAEGLSALHQQLIQTGLAQLDGTSPQHRLTALRAFWTWQRYAALLYAKQPYTPAGKGLPIAQPRLGARLQPSLALYQSLMRVVVAHCQFTPHPSWDAFAKILAQVISIASRQQVLGAPPAEDEDYLNELDSTVKQLVDGPDLPIVVDVHANPSSGQVLQEATGYVRIVYLDENEAVRNLTRSHTVRGARFTQFEFKQLLNDRLTDSAWRERLKGLLAAGDAMPLSVPLREKLGAQLLGLVESHRNGGIDSALTYAKSNSLDLSEDRVSVHVVATSEQDVNHLEQCIKDVGGGVESKFENSIFAIVPIAELGVFAASEAVWRMDAQRTLFAPPTQTKPLAEPPQDAKQGDDG